MTFYPRGRSRDKSGQKTKRAIKPTPIVGTLKGRPVIAVERQGIDLMFWCQWCRTVHVHGGDPGHRTSHCRVPDSPLIEGYYLQIDKLDHRHRGGTL